MDYEAKEKLLDKFRLGKSLTPEERREAQDYYWYRASIIYRFDLGE